MYNSTLASAVNLCQHQHPTAQHPDAHDADQPTGEQRLISDRGFHTRDPQDSEPDPDDCEDSTCGGVAHVLLRGYVEGEGRYVAG